MRRVFTWSCSGRVTGAFVDAGPDGAGASPGGRVEVAARVVINATGVWADDLRALEGYHSAQVQVDVRLNTNESPYPPPDGWLADPNGLDVDLASAELGVSGG